MVGALGKNFIGCAHTTLERERIAGHSGKEVESRCTPLLSINGKGGYCRHDDHMREFHGGLLRPPYGRKPAHSDLFPTNRPIYPMSREKACSASMPRVGV